MGIYIRNIDIPEIKRGVAAIINIDDILFLKTEDDIVLVPDHGDLIDRDKLTATDSWEWIRYEAPVVIPAERSEDGET